MRRGLWDRKSIFGKLKLTCDMYTVQTLRYDITTLKKKLLIDLFLVGGNGDFTVRNGNTPPTPCKNRVACRKERKLQKSGATHPY